METGLDIVQPIGGPQAASLQDVMSRSAEHDDRAEAMSVTFDAGLKIAMQEPNGISEPTSLRDQLLGDGSNPMLPDGTDSKRPSKGSAEASGDEMSENNIDQSMQMVAEHMRSIYTELTNYTIAWSIARRSGKDTDTLIKGQ